MNKIEKAEYVACKILVLKILQKISFKIKYLGFMIDEQELHPCKKCDDVLFF